MFLFVSIFGVTINNLVAAQKEIHVGCIDLSEVKPSYAVTSLFSASIECANNSEYEKAARLFLLARVYASYDMLRVADHTGHQVITILVQKTFSQMGDNATRVETEINANLIKNPQAFKDFCERVDSIGKPSYHPNYMINHGMNVLLGEVNNNGIKEDFDADKAWIKTMGRCK